MNPNNHFICFATILFSLGLMGCASERKLGYERLGSGYGLTTYVSGIVHKGYRSELEYRDSKGKRTMIWPVVASGPGIKDDMAVFSGLRLKNQPVRGPEVHVEHALFAVKAPGPALDIKSELLYGWCRESGKDFSKALKTVEIGTAGAEGDGVVVTFSFKIMDLNRVHLTWDEVSDIIREVKEKGTTRKDQWGVTYIEKVFPDTQQ